MTDPRIVWVGGAGYDSPPGVGVSVVTVPALPGLGPYAVLAWVISGTGTGGASKTNFTDNNGVNRGFTDGTIFALGNPGQPLGFFQSFYLRNTGLLLNGGGSIVVGGGGNTMVAACAFDTGSNDTVDRHDYQGQTRALTPTMNEQPWGPPPDPGFGPQVAFYANFGGESHIVNNGGVAWTLQGIFHQAPGSGPGTTVAVSTYQKATGVAYTPPSWQITVNDPEIWGGAAVSLMEVATGGGGRSYATLVG